MRHSLIALSVAALLAGAGAAVAQSQPVGSVGANQSASVAGSRTTGTSLGSGERSAQSGSLDFISPNDPRYAENGAPRVGEVPDSAGPYAPIHGVGGSSW